MRTFVLGDIHGAYKALLQCIERSGIDKEKDRLIFLGDVADGWSQTPECIEELLTFKNLIIIAGNHDLWTENWLRTGEVIEGWRIQGGQATIDAYVRCPELMSVHEETYYNRMVPYEILGDSLFTHAGYDISIPLEQNTPQDFAWDRDIFRIAKSIHTAKVDKKVTDWEEIYIGHTSTSKFSDVPIKMAEVWAMDQGAGWFGKLSIMDISTKQYWQSDCVLDLYPDELGRRAGNTHR